MKECFNCSTYKDLDEFYNHKGMKDGKLNKCKECCRIQSKERVSRLRLDEEFVEKERVRGREKYSRLNYKDKYKSNIIWNTNKYKNQSRRLKIQKGFEVHHWSYEDEYFEDVIIVTVSTHRKLHRHIVLDKKTRMFFKKGTNELLDTKEKHLAYLKEKGIEI